PADRFRKAEHLAHLLEAALQSPTAYMTSRDELVRTLEETFDTAAESRDLADFAVGTAVSETKPTPEVPPTVEAPQQRRWQWVAGALGVLLLVVIALFANSLLNGPDVVGETAVSPNAARTELITVVSSTQTAELSLISEPAEPTANPEFIVVLQQADSAIWQSGDLIQRIPENGRVPFAPPLMFQSSSEPVRLLLPNLVSIILDTNSAVWVESAAPGGEETVLRLEQGRVLVETQAASVRVYHEAGQHAEISGGSLGVSFDKATEEWAVDCLAGECQLGLDEDEEQVALAEGLHSIIMADLVMTTPSAARYSAFTNLAQTIPQPSATPTTIPSDTPSPTPAQTATVTPLPTFIAGFRGPEKIVLGHSAGGNEISVTRFGNGPQSLLLVGGIHSGYAPNSVYLVQELVTYFSQNLTAIPENVTLYIITNINPDAPLSPGELVGRLNANGVDLNRNGDCRWVPDALIMGDIVPGSGGTEAFSEPETWLLKSLVEQIQPQAVLFWEVNDSKNGVVSPGACEVHSLVSVPLVQYYANVTGYDYVRNPEVMANFELTGDVSNWLDKIGIPALFVLLPDYEQYDFQREVQGVLSVVTAVANPATLQQTPTPENCLISVYAAWETLYLANRIRLGCAQSVVTQPLSVWQPFANGRILWRKDTDTVYVLYNDRTLDTFLVNQPGLEGFQVSELIKGAIGYVYDSNTAVATKLGAPQDQERQAADVFIQEFSNGFIISWQDEGTQTNLVFLEAEEWQIP
ncbi:MAG: hypothetical protein KC445_20445, partial [Anaerolineales bacterium]|nr:hypothetical protein [Anaerolineales bacterium]